MPVLLSQPLVEVGPGRLYSHEYADCYFQVYAPLDEVQYVFIDGVALLDLWDQCLVSGQKICTLGETGFGAGLNFLMVWQSWEQWCQCNPASVLQLHFISVELSPLTPAALRSVYEGFPSLAALSEQLIKHWPPQWQGCHIRRFAPRLQLSLLFGDGLDMLQEYAFLADAWLLDGFSPSRNAKIWNQALYQCLASHSKPGTRLATFTAAGHVRRGLEAVGFRVEVKPGFQKRQMSIATFRANSLQRRPELSNLKPIPQRIAIIGAGYAGLHLAQALVAQGLEIQMFDAQSLMAGASGNHTHLLYLHPRLTVNAFNLFFEQAYSYSIAHYAGQSGVTPTGVLHLIQNGNAGLAKFTAESVAASWPADWLQLVDAAQASTLLGLEVLCPGLWMPNGLVISPKLFAENLMKRLQIIAPDQFCLVTGQTLIGLKRVQQQWHLKFLEPALELQPGFDAVVLASGAGTLELLKLLGNKCLGTDPSKPSHWRYPLRPIAGQSSVIAPARFPSIDLAQLKNAVCANGYVIPMIDGLISIGSTFEPDQWVQGVTEAAHLTNLNELAQCFGLEAAQAQTLAAVEYGVAATRIQTTDYLPMVGSIFPEQGEHLYVMAGFGAKGACVTPFAADILMREICQLPSLLPQAMQGILHPGRFARRIRKNEIC